MPSKTSAAEPPVIKKPEADKPEPSIKWEAPEVPHPDVTSWAEKLNERVSVPWRENETRAGRAFLMPGATMDEARELCEVFKAWSTGLCMQDGSPCILIRPSINSPMPRPGLGQKPGR